MIIVTNAVYENGDDHVKSEGRKRLLRGKVINVDKIRTKKPFLGEKVNYWAKKMAGCKDWFGSSYV